MSLIRCLLSGAFLLVISLSIHCRTKPSLNIPYPLPAPDSVAVAFLPGIVSMDSLDFNAAFAADGQTFYFSRSIRGKWVMLETRYDGQHWSKPAPAPFTDTLYSEADPAFAPDGSVYFISNRPRHAADTLRGFDIWRRRLLANGSWGELENVKAVNTGSTEYYVSFAANGNLYFASDRPGGQGGLDLYMSKWTNGQYTTPVNLGPAINSPGTEHDPCISPQEDYLVFTAGERVDTLGQADLYGSKKVNGNWCTSFNLGARVNTPTYEYCSSFSPDGRYLFFSSDYDVKWIKAAYVMEDIDRRCR
ncbi:Xaa-Pro aminopeptidase [Pseudoflavitalea sp. X16]|uniref:PD40 domain-containing protein n=1 Tax=Paraflavitalea devenefica TaxID=2716334 RepID=UPI00141F5430|nr:PD40 domain-containing protein [Paraflavitalea devenefica]NII28879.1 Xaa-Pro aminopeptidase [Paraflavitalea devenefica]